MIILFEELLHKKRLEYSHDKKLKACEDKIKNYHKIIEIYNHFLNRGNLDSL